MKTKLLFSALAIATTATYLGTVGYVHVYDKEQSTKLIQQAKLSGESELAMKVMYDNGCQYCHTSKPELPFYASLPVLDKVLADDIKKGTRVFRLDSLLEGMKDPKKLSEASLAKLERVLINNEMPITSFKHIHWGSSPNEEEKSTILNWIHKQREANFLPKETQGVDATRLIQPIPNSIPTDPLKVELGNTLYHDGRLSSDGTIQCHTCHQLNNGGVDGLTTSTGIKGQKGGINAPTVYNAAFNFLQFWDGRANDLMAQAGGPPLNPIEMGSKHWKEITDKIEQDKDFMQKFLAVYSELNDKTITNAIAEFEKTLITPDSDFDLYLKGNKEALTQAQLNGYKLFKENKCDTCHTGTAMGGQSFEYMGLYDDYFKARGTELTDADKGRFAQTNDPVDMHKFKVPTLRNIALTAPYMHDGSVKTLKDAVKVMLHYQSGKDLSDKEISDITSFLESLTGKYQGKKLGEK